MLALVCVSNLNDDTRVMGPIGRSSVTVMTVSICNQQDEGQEWDLEVGTNQMH